MKFKRTWMTAALALAALAGANQALGQEKAPKPDTVVIEETDKIMVVGAPRPGVTMGGAESFVFFSSMEGGFDSKVVKGSPYSAEATTETVQTLSDGNRIVRKNSATIYRDGDGRTRREQTLNVIGPWTSAGDPPKTIFINDPVARINYILEPKTQTARKMGVPQLAPGQTFSRIATATGAGTPGVRVIENGGPNLERTELLKPKVESLGRQTIEGVEAEGTRTTITILAGQIGNERPIEIVSEKWYSPELQTIVMSKRTDPMAGETTYKLTNINRSEPSRALFEVPAGYTVKEGAGFNFNYRVRKPEDK
jgi:hypothetical protein